MAVTRLECPECGAVLKRSDGVPEGRKVKCPSCSTTFAAKGDNKGPNRDPRDDNERPAPRSRKADRDEDDDDEPRSRSKGRGKKPKQQSSALLIAVPIIGAVGLLAVGIALYLTWPDKEKPVVADNGGGGAAVRPNPVPNPNPNPNPAPKVTPKGAAAGNAGGTGIEIGQVAMEIDGEDIDGQRFKLSDYRGKVVVLDFWGHW